MVSHKLSPDVFTHALVCMCIYTYSHNKCNFSKRYNIIPMIQCELTKLEGRAKSGTQAGKGEDELAKALFLPMSSHFVLLE